MCEWAISQRYMQLTTGYIEAVRRKNKKLRIYLAHHGIEDVRFWADRLQEFLEEQGYEIVNPFTYDENARQLTKTWDKLQVHTYEMCKNIVKKDLGFIDSCDVLLAYVPNIPGPPTIGMPMEIFYAHSKGKPVIIFAENYDSPWLIAHGKVVKTCEELLEELKKCIGG